MVECHLDLDAHWFSLHNVVACIIKPHYVNFMPYGLEKSCHLVIEYLTFFIPFHVEYSNHVRSFHCKYMYQTIIRIP